MKTIWFCGEDENILTATAEFVGEELINRNQNVELIVQSEVESLLGAELKGKPDEKSVFIDRLGFLGHLLHRNEAFALIVSPGAPLEDRKKAKENYKNYIQINISKVKDELCDLDLSPNDDPESNVKKIIEYLILEKIISEKATHVYSKEEEKEIRRRLEELGYV